MYMGGPGTLYVVGSHEEMYTVVRVRWIHGMDTIEGSSLHLGFPFQVTDNDETFGVSYLKDKR